MRPVPSILTSLLVLVTRAGTREALLDGTRPAVHESSIRDAIGSHAAWRRRL